MNKKINLIFFVLLFLQQLNAESIPTPRERYGNKEWSSSFPKELIEGKQGDQPLITPFSFRSIADIVIDQNTYSFDPDTVHLGDLIYINVWYLDWFEEKVHDKIKVPYLLVCCDVGGMVPDFGNFKKLLHSPKLAAWFGKNMAFSNHPKCYQIAMGQNDLLWTNFYTEGYKKYFLELVYKNSFEKKHLLYMNHCPRSFCDRDKIVKMFENESYCFTRNHSSQPYHGTPRGQYFDDLVDSQFVISPIGLEIDCVRNWEAFPLHCIPIVEHTYLDPLYEGLPIVLVNDYKEVTQDFLERKMQEIQTQKTSLDKAFFGFWEHLIKDVQKKVRQDSYYFSNPSRTNLTDQEIQDLKSILTSKYTKKKLLCIGSLMTLRPSQIKKALDISKIYTFDHWAKYNSDSIKNFGSYEEVRGLLKNESVNVFLDLTYFRSSLNLNLNTHPRHTLKRDITKIYQSLDRNCILCGNMCSDPYVKEVINTFSQENNLSLQKVNNFWYFLKK